MQKLIILFILTGFCAEAQNKVACPCPCAPVLRNDSFNLDQKDLFVISEYMETEYQVFKDQEQLNLPANLSSVNYYVDINGETDSTNLVDINYLYLQGYHQPGVTEGEAFYLLSKKNIPMGLRKTNIRSAKTIDLYSEIGSIIGMSFGYWKLDLTTNRILIMFRDRTKIWNMENFRIFSGLVLDKNIYLTKSMNTKDAYLFDYNFKKNKEVFVKLPLGLENVFYSRAVINSDTAWYRKSIRTKAQIEDDKSSPVLNSKQRLEAINNPENRALIRSISDTMSKEQRAQHKRTLPVKDSVQKQGSAFYAAIKYSYYPSTKDNYIRRKVEYLDYDSLSFKFVKKSHGKKNRKYVLFEARKGKLLSYSKIDVSQYSNYYSTRNQKEFILIHVADPYDEKHFQTFRIPYSGENFLGRLISFFKKKILDS